MLVTIAVITCNSSPYELETLMSTYRHNVPRGCAESPKSKERWVL